MIDEKKTGALIIKAEEISIRASNSAMRSFLMKNGFSKEEAEENVSKINEKNLYEKAKLKENLITMETKLEALNLGIDDKKLSYFSKMASLEDSFKIEDSGERKEFIRNSLKNVLEIFPEIKEKRLTGINPKGTSIRNDYLSKIKNAREKNDINKIIKLKREASKKGIIIN